MAARCDSTQVIVVVIFSGFGGVNWIVNVNMVDPCPGVKNYVRTVYTKSKGKEPPGRLLGGARHLSDHIFHAPGAKFWHCAAELHMHSLS